MPSDNATNLDQLDRAALLDILNWYVDAGVDEVTADDSVDHFAELAAIPQIPNVKAAPAARTTAPKPAIDFSEKPTFEKPTVEKPTVDKPHAPPHSTIKAPV